MKLGNRLLLNPVWLYLTGLGSLSGGQTCTVLCWEQYEDGEYEPPCIWVDAYEHEPR